MIWVLFVCVAALAFMVGLLIGKEMVKRAINYARITGFADTPVPSSPGGDPRFVEAHGKTYRLIDPDDYVSGESTTKVCQAVHKEFGDLLTNLRDFITLEQKQDQKEEEKKESDTKVENETKTETKTKK